jgi:hypothetical protein
MAFNCDDGTLIMSACAPPRKKQQVRLVEPML